MTDYRLTQAAVEQFARAIPPPMQVTQAVVEQWASVATVVVVPDQARAVILA